MEWILARNGKTKQTRSTTQDNTHHKKHQSKHWFLFTMFAFVVGHLVLSIFYISFQTHFILNSNIIFHFAEYHVLFRAFAFIVVVVEAVLDELIICHRGTVAFERFHALLIRRVCACVCCMLTINTHTQCAYLNTKNRPITINLGTTKSKQQATEDEKKCKQKTSQTTKYVSHK